MKFIVMARRASSFREGNMLSEIQSSNMPTTTDMAAFDQQDAAAQECSGKLGRCPANENDSAHGQNLSHDWSGRTPDGHTNGLPNL
jgi:hypothetical protein